MVFVTENLLLLSDPPKPPRNLRADDIDKTTATLTWEPPEFDGGSPVTGYIIEKFAFKRWTKVNKKPVKDLSFHLTDLIENSEYEFRVLAQNEAGISKPSETVHFIAKLPYDVPGKAGKPVVDEITAVEASLSWASPESDGGSPITNYLVEMKVKGDRKWKALTSGQQLLETSYTVTGLKEETDYEFRITAENKAGPGPASEPTTAKYVEPIVFTKPLQDITLTSIPKEITFECEISKKGISVEWYKGDKIIKRSDRYDIVRDGCAHRLVIHDATGDDEAEYTVVISEDVKSSATLTVEGKF